MAESRDEVWRNTQDTCVVASRLANDDPEQIAALVRDDIEAITLELPPALMIADKVLFLDDAKMKERGSMDDTLEAIENNLTDPEVGSNARMRGNTGSHYFRKPDFPKLDGKRGDYPSFRHEWIATVARNYNADFQVREIRGNVPMKVEPDLEMKAIWAFLDREYGQAMEG